MQECRRSGATSTVDGTSPAHRCRNMLVSLLHIGVSATEISVALYLISALTIILQDSFLSMLLIGAAHS